MEKGYGAMQKGIWKGLKSVAPSCKKCENSVYKDLKNNKYVSNHVYMKSSKLPKYFKQRCYVKSFCKNSKSSDVTAVAYCWFVRQRFVKSASTDRNTFSMARFPDAFCWLQTFLIACVYYFCGRFWKHVCYTPRVKKARHCWRRRAS